MNDGKAKELKLDAIFSDGMIIQRHKGFKVYGRDQVNYPIRISFDDWSIDIWSDKDGYFETTIDHLLSGGPYVLTIEGTSIINIQDVWVGDVFLLTGQSNMELPLSRVMEIYGREIQDDLKNDGKIVSPIRQFSLDKKPAFEEKDSACIQGAWQALEKINLVDISAVGYFFAKTYQKDHDNIPVGLIQASVGGSPIEAWCSREILEALEPEILEQVTPKYTLDEMDQVCRQEARAISKWHSSLESEDESSDSHQMTWEQISRWDSLEIPCAYEDVMDLNGFSGVVWLGKQINIGKEQLESLDEEQIIMKFGRVVDQDDVWINGQYVGGTSYQYPPRRYRLPKDLLKVGSNLILIRHVVQDGMGEFLSGKPYGLYIRDCNLIDRQWMNLRGLWHYKKGKKVEPAPSQTFFNWKPTALYYGMLYPIRKTGLKGILWYQGESNVMSQYLDTSYAKLNEAMLMGFRRLFGDEKLPVVQVILAGFGKAYENNDIGRVRINELGKFRLEQLRALSNKYTYMVSAMDLGEYNDIHPVRKKKLGERIAEVFKHIAEDENYLQSPFVEEVQVEAKLICLGFGNIKTGLHDKKQSCLIVTYEKEDGTLEYVKSHIQHVSRNGLVLSMEQVDGKPIRVAYGIEDFPYQSRIYDGEWPLFPFSISLPSNHLQ